MEKIRKIKRISNSLLIKLFFYIFFFLFLVLLQNRLFLVYTSPTPNRKPNPMMREREIVSELLCDCMAYNTALSLSLTILI